MARTLAVFGAVLALALATLAGASPDQGKGKSKGKGHEEQATAAFGDHDRDAVRAYWVETYGRDGCPPGLAKKNNGCLPPGQAKKRYAVGQRLPSAVVIQPLPAVLVTRLGPPPTGYEYAVVDGDVLKLVVGTRMVVDAITALVH